MTDNLMRSVHEESQSRGDAKAAVWVGGGGEQQEMSDEGRVGNIWGFLSRRSLSR